MRQWVMEGKFREDLYARINMWTFALPGLAERREDIAPNIEFELQRFSSEAQTHIRFDKDARERYLAFACSGQAQWRGNFRELSSSIARMATLAEQGRITFLSPTKKSAVCSTPGRRLPRFPFSRGGRSV
jgi:transcriptional regulatory protein RtcR